MAATDSIVYNNFHDLVMSGSLNMETADIRVKLLMSNTTAGDDPDADNIDDITTLDICDGTNYVDKALATQAVTKDDTNNRGVFDADDPTWSSLGAGTRNTAGYLAYLYVDGTDANDIPLWYVGFANQFVHTGADFTLPWNSSDGLLYMNQAA